MAFVTRQPTANESPDTGQGGSAVTTPANTGHASTTSSAVGDDVGVTETKTCRWFTFPTFAGRATAITLKFTHTSSGALSGAGINAFEVDYTLNGGSAWNVAVSRSTFTAAEGPTVHSVALSASQDVAQVQVRDLIEAFALNSGDSSSATATISDIKLEITVDDGNIIVMA